MAFSRKQLYSFRRHIEVATGRSCCIVYGSLPPEARKEQARTFNDEEAPGRADFLLAGAILIERILAACGLEETLISDRGLRFGVIREGEPQRDH